MSVGASFKLKSQFISPPIDGLNLISDPLSIKPGEARQLDNYYIYDWGIRERGATTHVALPVGADYPVAMLSFASTTYPNGAWIIASTTKIYKWDGTTFTQISTDPTNVISDMFAYNKHVFMCDVLTTEIHSYDTAANTYSDTSFTGGPTDPITGFAFKNRCYILGRGDSVLYYGGSTSISGALDSSYDIGQFFQNGTGLIWGCSWSYNQGVTNDELLVVGNEAGEVFIYSGDWPAAANWQLVTRVKIPSPLTANPGASGLKVPVVKLGQDVLIGTNRGVISLQQVLAGRRDGTDTDYYSISKNLGYVMGWQPPAVSAAYPFAYFGSSTGGEMYVLNYERGSWSKFKALGPTSLNGMSIQAPPLYGNNSAPGGTSLVLIADRNGGFWKLNEGATVSDSTMTATWGTPFFNFDSPLKKRPVQMDVIARDMASTSISNTVTVLSDFNETVSGAAGTATTAVASTAYALQRLAPAGNPSIWLSYKFSKTCSGSAINELAGFNAFYEEGGSS